MPDVSEMREIEPLNPPLIKALITEFLNQGRLKITAVYKELTFIKHINVVRHEPFIMRSNEIQS
jgi:hypothetical protein